MVHYKLQIFTSRVSIVFLSTLCCFHPSCNLLNHIIHDLDWLEVLVTDVHLSKTYTSSYIGSMSSKVWFNCSIWPSIVRKSKQVLQALYKLLHKRIIVEENWGKHLCNRNIFSMYNCVKFSIEFDLVSLLIWTKSQANLSARNQLDWPSG